MAAKDRKCAGIETRPDCPNQIFRDSITGLCNTCLNEKRSLDAEARHQRVREERAQRTEEEAAARARREEARRESQARLATQQGTEEDRLRRDLGYAQTEIARLQRVVRSWEERSSIEDRAVEGILRFLEENPYRPQLGPRPDPTPRQPGDHQMMAVISDAHYPEVVDPLQTFGIKYDGDICRRRLEYIRDKIIRYVDLRRSAYNVRKVTLAVVGDMLSGNIHEELAITNQLPMSESLVNMSYMLYDLGSSIAQEVEEVEMIVMPGNHPRITKKPSFKAKWDNWETVMGHFVAGLAKDQFTVTVPKDLVYRHQIFGFTIGLSHGDGVQAASFAGIPWYAMKSRQDAIQSLLKSLGQDQLDMLVYGHFHRLIFDEGQGCSLFINGSIKGGDEFSTGTRYQAQAPVQGLITFHPRHGMTDLSRINLGKIQ